MGFFDERESAHGPEISDDLIAKAERKLGVRLPEAYLDLLKERMAERRREGAFPRSAPPHGPATIFRSRPCSGLVTRTASTVSSGAST